jgi:hypothetical protein
MRRHHQQFLQSTLATGRQHQNPMLVDYICTQLNLVAQMGSAPSHWGVGLQVLLEKIPGISLVEKL